jgi:poly-beta-hydroxyalkanoate depolymerase
MITAYQDDAELAKFSLDFAGAAREMIKVLATGVLAGAVCQPGNPVLRAKPAAGGPRGSSPRG